MTQSIIDTGLDGLTTVRTSTVGYSASDGELIITDANSVDLPDPTANAGAVILVKPVGNAVILDTPAGQIADQSNNQAMYEGSDALWLQSDGSNWYVRSDLQNIGPAIPDSAVARYAFEGDYKDSWFDNDGSPSGDPSFVSGIGPLGSQAVNIDSNDGIDLPPLGLADSSLSVAGWVNIPTINSQRQIVALGNDGNNKQMGLRIETDTSISFIYFDGTENGLSDVGSITEGSDVFICGTFNASTGDWTLYKNDASQVVTTTDDVFIDLGDEADNSIGYLPGAGRHLEGVVDIVDIYDKELSSSEVSNLYNTGSIS